MANSLLISSCAREKCNRCSFLGCRECSPTTQQSNGISDNRGFPLPPNGTFMLVSSSISRQTEFHSSTQHRCEISPFPQPPSQVLQTPQDDEPHLHRRLTTFEAVLSLVVELRACCCCCTYDHERDLPLGTKRCVVTVNVQPLPWLLACDRPPTYMCHYTTHRRKQARGA